MRKLACMVLVFMLLPLVCLGETAADRYDLLPGNGAEDQRYTVAIHSDVKLRISCDDRAVLPGETVTFIVTVENGSGGPLENMTLSELSVGGGRWAKSPSQLPAGEQLETTYTVRIPDTVHDIALFQLQWQGGTMTAQHEMNVTEPLQLMVTAEVADWPWRVGEEHTANFTVTNPGNAALTNVTLTLPGAYLEGEKIGDTVFLRKDRRKLKSAQQTSEMVLEELAPGDSVTMTAAWIPETLPEGTVAMTMQAAVEQDGRMQTRAAMALMEHVVVKPSMWTTVIKGNVTMGHVLCALAGLTLLTALAALIRAKKLR